MKFTLTIDIGNDAMQTNEQIAQAIGQAADRLEEYGGEPQLGLHDTLSDDSGNRVGSWVIQ